MSINRCAAGLAALLAVAASQPAAAQSYPAQNINFLVSFAAGGVADVLARLLALKITEKTGKTIVTENRGGAGGNLAARAVAGAAADGYTVLATTTALAISATASRNRGFQASDLKAVAVVASTPDVLAVHPSHPAKTLTEYIAGAKGKPTNFGSSGTGTTPHIATEYLLRILAKLDVTHVTFTGGAPAVAAAVGNHINLLSSSLPTAVAQINEGQLRGLGVASQNRSKAAAQVPTMARHSAVVSCRGVNQPLATGSAVGPTGCHCLAPAFRFSSVSGPMPCMALCDDALRPPWASWMPIAVP